MHEALQRAASVSCPARICTVLAEQHRRGWQPMLDEMCADNIIVQPSNRGTANGILLPLLHIAERDPEARLLLLPSDHHICDEAVLSDSMRRAVALVAARPLETVLLGLTPERTDPELGYILPGRLVDGVSEVEQLIEKPPMSVAHGLIEHGGLWNAFIIAASVPGLLALFSDACPRCWAI